MVLDLLLLISVILFCYITPLSLLPTNNSSLAWENTFKYVPNGCNYLQSSNFCFAIANFFLKSFMLAR